MTTTTRRAFLATSFPLLTGRLLAEAQQRGKAPRIGVLTIVPGPTPNTDAFVRGLQELGYIVDKTITIEWRWAAGNPDRFPRFARELAAVPVDAVVAGGSQAIVAAAKATTTIPIVMVGAADPVRLGLVASLARPGGNITGVTLDITPEVMGKQVELLTEALPRLKRLSMFLNPSMQGYEAFVKAVDEAAQRLRVSLQKLSVTGPHEVNSAFAAATQDRADAVVVMPDAVLYGLRQTIVDLAMKHRLPTVHLFADIAQAGGFMAYGPSLAEQYHRAAAFVDRILKGTKPSDLPVELPTKLELVINLKTAKAFGLTIPPSLLARADQLIH